MSYKYKLPLKVMFHPEKVAQILVSVCAHGRSENYPSVLGIEMIDGKMVFELDRPLSDEQAQHLEMDDSEIVR